MSDPISIPHERLVIPHERLVVPHEKLVARVDEADSVDRDPRLPHPAYGGVVRS